MPDSMNYSKTWARRRGYAIGLLASSILLTGVAIYRRFQYSSVTDLDIAEYLSTLIIASVPCVAVGLMIGHCVTRWIGDGEPPPPIPVKTISRVFLAGQFFGCVCVAIVATHRLLLPMARPVYGVSMILGLFGSIALLASVGWASCIHPRRAYWVHAVVFLVVAFVMGWFFVTHFSMTTH